MTSTTTSPAPTTSSNLSLPETLWSLTIPLLITHPSSPNPPFITTLPRFSYLSLLLPRLTSYFNLPCSSFHHEEIQLRNLPLGLLFDLYQPTSLPWKLTLGQGPEWDIGDTFLNGAKEADFVRFGSAKGIMGMSKADTQGLWNGVVDSMIFFFFLLLLRKGGIVTC